MRKRVVAVLAAAAMALAPAALADPPSDDPTGGNGGNGSAGCQGINRADEDRDSNSDAAFDLVNVILDSGDDGDCSTTP